jgi:hypothetical protein
MGPATDDNVIYPSKSSLTVPDGPVHVLLEGRLGVPEAEGHPVVLKEAERDGLLHVCWVDWNLLAALPLANIEKKLCNTPPSAQNKE